MIVRVRVCVCVCTRAFVWMCAFGLEVYSLGTSRSQAAVVYVVSNVLAADACLRMHVPRSSDPLHSPAASPNTAQVSSIPLLPRSSFLFFFFFITSPARLSHSKSHLPLSLSADFLFKGGVVRNV